MKKVLLIGLTALLLIASTVVFLETRPSGNIDAYANYFTNDTGSLHTNQVKVTFFGVSTLLFDDGETQLLLDGFFSRPSLSTVFLTDIESDKTTIDQLVADYKMERVKGIFVTHSHYDHAFDVAYVAKKTRAMLFGSASTLNIGRGGDIPEKQLSQFQLNREVQLGKFTVVVIPSIHSSNSTLKDERLGIDQPIRQPASMKAYLEGGSYDFYIKHEGHSIYVKPSPNYMDGALDSLRADVVFIGIATISNQEKFWQEKYYYQTVGTLKPSMVIPIHWDDFFQPVSDHLVMLPKLAKASTKDFDFFIEKTKADGIDFKIVQGTKSIVLFKEGF